MWNRAELKARGKFAFKANYWRCVIVALIMTILFSGGAARGAQQAGSGDVNINFNGGPLIEFDSLPPAVTGAIIAGVAVGGVIGIIIAVFLLNPLNVGGQRFFIVNAKEPAELNELGWPFKNCYGNVVKTMLLTDVYVILWSLLFIIPGIIKGYAYMMVPYILAENPSLDANEAITISRQMMNGNKWKAFVFDLSYILWDIASVITLGVLGIFYVGPYKFAAKAELYYAIKAQAGY